MGGGGKRALFGRSIACNDARVIHEAFACAAWRCKSRAMSRRGASGRRASEADARSRPDGASAPTAPLGALPGRGY